MRKKKQEELPFRDEWDFGRSYEHYLIFGELTYRTRPLHEAVAEKPYIVMEIGYGAEIWAFETIELAQQKARSLTGNNTMIFKFAGKIERIVTQHVSTKEFIVESSNA